MPKNMKKVYSCHWKSATSLSRQNDLYVSIAGLSQGDEITHLLLPNDCKLIVWGKNREEACDANAPCFGSVPRDGLGNNIAFLTIWLCIPLKMQIWIQQLNQREDAFLLNAKPEVAAETVIACCINSCTFSYSKPIKPQITSLQNNHFWPK